MKIVVVNTAASDGGGLSILKDFYHYVRNNDKQNEWIFLVSDNYIEDTKNIKVSINKESKSSWIKRLKWELIDARNSINNLNPDIVFSMQNTMGMGIKCKKIIYLHQSIPFQKYKKFSFFKKEERKLAIYQYIIGKFIKNSINRVDKVIVQTKWMKKAVINQTRVQYNNTIVIQPEILEIKEKIKSGYPVKKQFFYPAGGGVIYKNHKCIVEAVKILLEEGYKDFKVELTLNEDEVIGLDITQDLREVITLSGHLSREEVFERYRESILLFPSYIETYGLPMLEASSVGGIILASNCEFSKEILEQYPNKYYFNPFEPNELADLMKQVINGEIKLKENKLEIKYVEKNSWQRVVREIYELANIN